MRYIISDTHFGHEKIIEYGQRPFGGVTEMNTELQRRWNRVVDEEDTVFHLGDVRHHPDEYDAEFWLDQLRGDIVLIRGNHDNVSDDFPYPVLESAVLNHDGYEFYLEHEPVGFSGWQIHGHCHNNDLVTYPFIHKGTKRVNVSAELLHYYPLALDRLVRMLDENVEQEYIPEHEIPK